MMNIRKCIEYLQRYERANPNYLWKVSEIVDGHSDVIWGLLDNIYAIFNAKPSRSKTLPTTKVDKGVGSFDIAPTVKLKDDFFVNEPFEEDQMNKKSKPSTQRAQLYSIIHAKHKFKFKASKKIQNLAMKLRKCNVTQPIHSITQYEKARTFFIQEIDYPKINNEEEKSAREWLKQLNLGITKAQESESLLKNPLRNGLLLCEVNLLNNK